MRFAPLTIISAIAAVVCAQSSDNPFKLNGNIQITAGQPYTISWTPTTSGAVTLKLRNGASSDLNSGTTIASGIQNSGSYTFTLPADTTRNSDYTIQISSDSDPSKVNYTPQFVVESKNTVASQSSASGSASATSSGKSSASTSGSATSSGSSASATSTGTNTSSGSSASSQTSSATARSSSVTTSRASSASAVSATTSAVAAPTNAASNLQVQGGLAAFVLGAAVLL